MSMIGDVEETLRVQTRDVIADVTHPLTFLLDSMLGMQRAFRDGSMRELFDAVFSHGATKMLQEVKDRCPIGDRTRAPGELRESLYVSTEDQSDFHGSGRASSLSVLNRFAYITTDLDYAYFVEYGSRHAPPHAFLRPAADSSWASVGAWIGDIVLTHVASGFVGRLLVDLADVVLAHSGKAKQRHGVVRDIAVHTAKAFAFRATGRLAKKAGGKLLGRSTPKTSGLQGGA